MSQLKQISRPFQIMLVATVVLFALWLVVLRNHSSSGESSPSTASSSVQPAAPARASGSSSGSSSASGSSGASSGSPAYHGSAPGVGGLTRAIAKARGAVDQSEQNARQLQHKENQASGTSAQTQKSRSHSSATTAPVKAHARTAPAKTASGSGAKTHTSPATTSSSSSGARAKADAPAMQSKVEAQLKHGQLVAILLWNPKSSVDKIVRRELQSASHALGGKLALHVALSAQVGSFGTFTRTVQVYSTPTILLINHKGATSSVPGLTDAFSIEQAVREAEQAS